MKSVRNKISNKIVYASDYIENKDIDTTFECTQCSSVANHRKSFTREDGTKVSACFFSKHVEGCLFSNNTPLPIKGEVTKKIISNVHKANMSENLEWQTSIKDYIITNNNAPGKFIKGRNYYIYFKCVSKNLYKNKFMYINGSHKTISIRIKLENINYDEINKFFEVNKCYLLSAPIQVFKNGKNVLTIENMENMVQIEEGDYDNILKISSK